MNVSIDVFDQTVIVREMIDTCTISRILMILPDVLIDPYVREKQSNEHFHNTLVLLMIHRRYSNFVYPLEKK